MLAPIVQGRLSGIPEEGEEGVKGTPMEVKLNDPREGSPAATAKQRGRLRKGKSIRSRPNRREKLKSMLSKFKSSSRS
ncbi:hypothetical protein R1flu_006447 [Riccia fluitans]|uniref:Uncharacterized protein n=1 Tax=Riccia fluitans TaxID=41844 RepID=A0ABD1YW12_9MARC